MKINIYENKKVVKTYRANDYDLMWGTVEDIVKVVKLDDLEEMSEDAIINLVGRLMITSYDAVKDLILSIFEDMTEEELRKTKMIEIAAVMIDVVIYTITKIEGTFSREKKMKTAGLT